MPSTVLLILTATMLMRRLLMRVTLTAPLVLLLMPTTAHVINSPYTS